MGKKVKKESASSCKETFEPLPIELKSPATVMLLLSSPEEEVLVKACEAIYKFAERGDENEVAPLGLGALEPLCQLINHNNKLVKHITRHHEDTVVHEFATLCLVSLSVDFTCKVQIFDNKGLPSLIQLLSSPDPDVAKNTVETIFNLVQDYPCRQAVHELGGIPPLLELLKSDFPVIQQLALKTLANVTTDKDTRTTFREVQGFEKLMDFLCNEVNVCKGRGDFSDLHVEALQVLANCVGESESVHLIHQGGGLTRLMQFVLTPSGPEVQSSAVKCISRVAQNSETRKLLHEQDVEKTLVELLSVEGDIVKMSACHAVAAMSLHLASKDSFRDLGGIRVLVQLLGSESSALREAAVQALCNLTKGSRINAFAVYEAGGHEILVQQLHDSCPMMVVHTAATLANMAEQEVIRCSIVSQGAAQALVEPLKSVNPEILVPATLCLAALVCNAEARAELNSAGGLPLLVNLLCSSHKEVRQNACWAVSVCASDESIALEMCKIGALELLQEINQSVNRRSKFSELALARLLDANLSIKYSLTGYLTSTDITSDGFYDAGKLRAGQKALTLEELSKQPVNRHQPIIAVNTASEKGKWTEDDKYKDEDNQKAQLDSATQRSWMMMCDASLQSLVTKATKSILPLNDKSEQYTALARLVSQAMGGPVEMDKLHEFPWELHLSELKFALQSNVVPIGMICKGIYCHRAILFKYLADRIGVSCTLVRGEYNRAWNEVLIFKGPPSVPGCSPQPCRYIVDLMHQPGSLLKANSRAAIQYQTI
uniref:Armadillo repeat containing 3 n=1 Tax=Myripristis murdjan TaxID=586833 RepID=A0A667X9B5_9TELE